MKILYEPRTFTPAAFAVIVQAEAICEDYARQGYSLTLRQLYYRFIATDAFPESRRDRESGTKNTQRNYKWLGDLVSDARIAGLIDWGHITDRTRGHAGGDAGWDSPAEAVRDITDQYGISRRLRYYERKGRATSVIYLGDHDPTGLDISRDIQDRLALFHSRAVVDRIALNMDQVEQYGPPPSPAKLTDSRAHGYIEEFGEDTWELDALEPAVLEGLVEEAILARLDRSLWDERVAREQQEKAILTSLADNWPDIVEYMQGMDMIPSDTPAEGDDEE